MGLEDMGIAEGDQLTIDWAESLMKDFREEIRRSFADYVKTEGIDKERHEKAENKLAKLLKPDMYEDKSGFDWYKYAKP